ncbi:short-chain dehydrogenase, putative [Talaromyces stipitatus ATCC 10500]|uniref:Short-chain dehydrogenase, putative n=1 Tax=Talaromyces stipitatus (strain ATCC 10500 / CBS 375.48 / QM 6759 / NRRL 1006) TaxID=441959 RepID=B8MFG7_TALSN|nr:short-chain dehydrogenase, putative [Talaromyces stipitatus ATCC 10500]EED16701.1 short-chain dehydrogenase, putative [Talaromyces stipitatus ATCC 10500]
MESISNGLLAEQDRQLELHAKIQLHSQKVAHRIQKNRPAATTRQYDSRQKEFIDFCTKEGFPDGQVVTEKKLVYFLDHYVINRPIRPSRYLRNRTDSQGAAVVQTLGLPSVKAYTSAIVDLWRFQQSLGTNPYPNPRGHLVGAMIKNHQFDETQRKRTQFTDRGFNTLQDGYTSENIRAIVRYCWAGWLSDQTRGRKPQAQEAYLRTTVDFLFGHNMLLRGEDRRHLELADLFTLRMDEGPTPCWPMILMKLNGKTNQFGRLEYMGVVRHKDPLLCTICHTAFYLFHRWEIMHEPVPQFYQRQQWYKFVLFKGSDSEHSFSYETQLKWINQVFQSIGLNSKKKTHSGRSSGARHAELQGVDENSIRRAGHWNQDSMSNCYLSELPRPFIRTLAGFKPTDQGNYYLPRAAIEPPETLVRALWPWIDQWLAWFSPSELNPVELSKLDLPPLPLLVQQGVEKCDQDDLAAQSFLKLLSSFRTVIIQDAVFLQQEFPGHSMWTHPLFQRSDFQSFSQQIIDLVRTSETPHEIKLRQTIPLVANRITTIGENLEHIIQLNHQQTQDSIRAIQSQMDQLFSGEVTFTARLTGSDEKPSTPGNTTSQSTEQNTAHTVVQSLQVTPNPIQDHPPGIHLPNEPSGSPPFYRMSRTIQTVRELWEEWHVGIHGNPSIQSLEDSYGCRWRSDNKERVFFSRRKVIIDWIQARVSKGILLADAIDEIELMRRNSQRTLYQLQALLKKEAHLKNQFQMDLSYDPARIKGKTILITGGASGFGAAFGARWASCGANVILGDINASGEEFAARIRQETNNQNVHFIQLDVTSWTSQVNFFRESLKLSPHGGIDVVVANAGINDGQESRVFENPKVDYLHSPSPPAPSFKTLDVNITGVMYTVHLALFFLPKNPGSMPCQKESVTSESGRDRHILLLGSVASLHPLVTQAAYTVSKHGVLGLFRCLRVTAPVSAGVRVNLICPYYTDTPFMQAPVRALLAGVPLGKIEDVVEAASYLVADSACIGRSLVTGPKLKLDESTGELKTPFDTQSGDTAEERAVWECCLHDMDPADIFTRRMLTVVNAAVQARGWTGWVYDMAGALTWPVPRWWNSR